MWAWNNVYIPRHLFARDLQQVPWHGPVVLISKWFDLRTGKFPECFAWPRVASVSVRIMARSFMFDRGGCGCRDGAGGGDGGMGVMKTKGE
jgi:hypothetical protein